MLKPLLFLYSVCVFCYIFYTREPDYFDSETCMALINTKQDSATFNYTINKIPYSFSLRNWFNNYKPNEEIEIIYNHTKPNDAKVYSFFGYWFNANEFLFSIIFFVGLYYVAVLLNKNAFEPSNTNEKDERPKRKYD